MEKNTANMDINVIPDIRFPGFLEKWEIKTLGELATKVNRKNRQLQVSRVLTNSATEGIIDQNDYFDRDIAVKENTENYHIVEAGDFVYNPRISVSAPVGPISVNKVGTGIMSPLYTVFRIQDGYIPFYEQYFQTKIWHSYLKSIANFGARFDRMNITTEGFFNMPIFVPSFAEQKKIAECLEVEDKMIAAQKQKVESLKAHKKGLMQQLFPQPGTTTPSLRFPGFTGEWQEKPFDSLCHTITPPLKLQSSQYLSSGKYPVIDQSQSLICGWTNDVNGLVNNIPSIIFGDHTCVLKFIDFPFVQGADGVKILRPIVGNDPRFVYQLLLSSPVKQDGYKRHFSDLKEKTFCLAPTHDEQNKLAECLFSLDQVISAEEKELEALKVHKQGLMQQLFPQFEK